MPRFQRCSSTTAAFAVDYERQLADFCGLAFNSRKLYLRVIRNLLATCFSSGHIRWHELHFGDLAEFLKTEFRRLPNHWTQRVWLMAVRRFVCMLALKLRREMERRLRERFGAPGSNPHAITLRNALTSLASLCLMQYKVDEKTTVTKLPQPSANQAKIPTALAVPLPEKM
jgi:hypothetical protein